MKPQQEIAGNQFSIYNNNNTVTNTSFHKLIN